MQQSGENQGVRPPVPPFDEEGARQKVDEHRKAGELRPLSRGVLNVETLESLEHDLGDLLRLLDAERGTD